MNRDGRGLVAALAACVVALVAAPAANAAVETKITAPKGADVMLEELTLKAKCDEACTLALRRVQAINFKGGQQLPATGEEPLKGTKKLKAGQTATFKVPLGPIVRSQIQTAVRDKAATVVQVVYDYNGIEGPYRSATLRTKSVAKAPAGQDDIVLAPKVKLRKGALRWRVSIKGVQTTTWHYNREETGADGCRSWARGDGTQTINFRSAKSPVVRYGMRVRAGEKKARPDLVGTNGSFQHWPVRMDVTRSGTRDHGASPECAGGGGGHCDDCGGGGEPQQCTDAKATRTGWLVLMLSETRKLYANDSNGQPLRLSDNGGPDCPIEPFKWSFGDIDLMHAFNKFGNPAQHGGGGKVIVILRNKETEPLDESGGYTTTSIRYTVTFTRV